MGSTYTYWRETVGNGVYLYLLEGDGREWGLLMLIGDCKSCDKLLEYVYKIRFSSRNNATICKY